MPTCPNCKHKWSVTKVRKRDSEGSLAWELLDPSTTLDKGVPSLSCKICHTRSNLATRPRYEHVCGKCLWLAQTSQEGVTLSVADALTLLRRACD